MIKRSQLREGGTSLGGCLRLVMLSLLLAYGVVVILQYLGSPNVSGSTLTPSSSSTNTYIQQITSERATVITVKLSNPDALTPCTTAPGSPAGFPSARTSGPVCPSRRGPVASDGTASQGGVGWAFVVRVPPGGFTPEELAEPLIVFTAVDGTSPRPPGMIAVPDPATYVAPPGAVVVTLETTYRYGSPHMPLLTMAVSKVVSRVETVKSGFSMLLEDFKQLDPESLGGQGCFGPHSATMCPWEDVLSPEGMGCGFMNESATGGKAYLRCRGGNFTVGPGDLWGVSLVQIQDFTVVTTVSSSKRGLLGVLGSIGGAYSIVFTVCALVYKCMWSVRASRGWTPEYEGAARSALQTSTSGKRVSMWKHVRHSVFGLQPLSSVASVPPAPPVDRRQS